MDSNDKSNLNGIQMEIYTHLKSMKLPAMAEAYREQAVDQNYELKPFEERLGTIIDAEWDARRSKKISRLMKAATLRYQDASFDDSLNDASRKLNTGLISSLSDGSWINKGKNLLITGLTGAGKTYLSNAFCVQAIQHFHPARYLKASRLMEEMEKARIQQQYMDYIDKTSRLDLLVIDDFGLMQLDLDKCRDLFEIIDSREGRKSTVIVSQYPVSGWFEMFRNDTYADACMSRITNNAYRIEMNGRNMRGNTAA